MENKFIKAMEGVSTLNETHGVVQKGGKQYTEVAKRVEVFRREFGGEYGIQTKLEVNDGKTVVFQAIIIERETGFVIGSGHAEEVRGSSYITKTSAIEVCETSAIGRALASLGLHGGQYASANEMVGVERKKEAISQRRIDTPQKRIETPEQRGIKLMKFIETATADNFDAMFDKAFNLIKEIAETDKEFSNKISTAWENKSIELGVS